ncbi:MAG: dTMP kinase, partial [Mariprofundaceae bacterium]
MTNGNNSTGRLITFEGGDGSGKSTQLRMTETWLREQEYEVLITHEPGDTALGAEIRSLLLEGEYIPVPECELLLFLADRAQHVREVMMPALKSGTWVLCDRYSDSTMAYQLAGRKLADPGGVSSMLSFAELG